MVFGWLSSVGLGIFLGGVGVFFWGFCWLRRQDDGRGPKE